MSGSGVTILFGGTSNERRVSVASAQNVSAVLDEAEAWFLAPSGAVHRVGRDELAGFQRPFEQDFEPVAAAEFPSVVAGFAGATADAFTLFERFEGKLKDFNKNLARAAVELAKDWRTDRFLRRLEALLIVADRERTLILSGTGDVVEPDEGVAAIGSGGPYAQAAALAMLGHSQLGARQIVEESLRIAGRICIYTNDQISIEEL